jgi:bifunctional DNA-binding transcriptional regulator/antitoxin component of YhaV-PrlF toxin-antitoxin module
MAEEMFRLRIAAKRQVTIPPQMLKTLKLAEGDEIRITVVDGQIKQAEACKLVPTRLFNKQVLEDLSQREEEMARGKSLAITQKRPLVVT